MLLLECLVVPRTRRDSGGLRRLRKLLSVVAPPDLPPANLQEFGIIAQVDAPVKEMILGKYFDPMFNTGVREFPREDRFTWTEA